MRIGGIEVKEPNEATMVLLRGETPVVFRARGILEFDEFNRLCPRPTAPVVVTKAGKKQDEKNKDYLTSLAIYNKRLTDYVIVKSLEPTQIEWDSVKLETPGTWTNWESDLKSAGFTNIEVDKIARLTMEANGLDDEKLKWAREVFLAGQATTPNE